MAVSKGAPLGIRLLQKCCSLGKYRRTAYQSSVWLLTFVAYTAFHMSRRPLAVVKNSLNQDCSKLTPPKDLILTNETLNNWCDWAPFDDSNANRLLGLLDSVHVFAYAICMFFSGMVAERIDLRYFLTIGMILSGIFTYMFGIAYYFNIHSLSFFIIVQILAGAGQSTGWPGVVSCVGNWFGKGRRGLIFGIWNAHVYVGNIWSLQIAGYFVVKNWGLSFIVPGAIVGLVGVLLFLFLVPDPEDVDCTPANHHGVETEADTIGIFYPSPQSGSNGSNKILKSPQSDSFNEKSIITPSGNQEALKHGTKNAITFWDALRIPGVIEFSLCLFFSKLVSYTFLFWLPRYLSYSTGEGSQESAYLSIAFDVGAILGGVLAGIISDHTGASALTCIGFLGLAIPSLFVFEVYGKISQISNISLQLICGALVNGPYALITTAVSAELGTHKSIKSDAKALGTVTAIIDGVGSIGAAIGPFLTGITSEYSWSYVFFMMMFACFLALLSLLRVGLKEVKQFRGSQYALPFVNKPPKTYDQIG